MSIATMPESEQRERVRALKETREARTVVTARVFDLDTGRIRPEWLASVQKPAPTPKKQRLLRVIWQWPRISVWIVTRSKLQRRIVTLEAKVSACEKELAALKSAMPDREMVIDAYNARRLFKSDIEKLREDVETIRANLEATA